MFKNLLGLGGDIVRIAIAPVEIAAAIVRPVTKPIADTTKEITKAINDLTDD